MKLQRKNGVLAGLCLALLLSGCDQSAVAESDAAEKGNKTALDTDIKRASYLLGYRQLQGLLEQTEGTIDADAFLQGVSDLAASAESQVDMANAQQLMQALQEAVSAKQLAASQGVRDAGDQYRTAYAAQDGVTALPSGLLYEVITEGSGDKPKETDTVTTHYHGTLVDGTVFDSSVERGQPASFPVNGVIRGWTEALQLMGVGSKWRLVIPPELAYGDRGAGAQIKPGATLVFEVELLGIQ